MMVRVIIYLTADNFGFYAIESEFDVKSELLVAKFEQVVVALFALGWLASVVVAAHHHDSKGNGIFFVDPFLSHNRLRQVELVLFIAGWMLMCLGPIAIAIRMLLVTDEELRFLPIVALLYPVSVLIIQLTLWQQSNHHQKPYSYLADNPWFIITDLIVPVGLLLVDYVVRNSREAVHLLEGQESPAEVV